MLININSRVSKWSWKMDYCKSMGFNPSFELYWDLAEKEFIRSSNE